jgi:hypothetical protein
VKSKKVRFAGSATILFFLVKGLFWVALVVLVRAR